MWKVVLPTDSIDMFSLDFVKKMVAWRAKRIKQRGCLLKDNRPGRRNEKPHSAKNK